MFVEQVEMAERGTAFLSCATASNVVRFSDKESAGVGKKKLKPKPKL
jgi:hypothetical protein